MQKSPVVHSPVSWKSGSFTMQRNPLSSLPLLFPFIHSGLLSPLTAAYFTQAAFEQPPTRERSWLLLPTVHPRPPFPHACPGPGQQPRGGCGASAPLCARHSPRPRSLPPPPGSAAAAPSGRTAGGRASGHNSHRSSTKPLRGCRRALAGCRPPPRTPGLLIATTPRTTLPRFQVLARSPTGPQRFLRHRTPRGPTPLPPPRRGVAGPPGPSPRLRQALTLGQRYSGVLGVDGVQDPFIADLGLRDKADLAADVGRPPAHGAGSSVRDTPTPPLPSAPEAGYKQRSKPSSES